MPMSDGVFKQRRPAGHRDEPDGPEPETSIRTFLYREDALADAKDLVGWETRIQYLGAWMRWTVVARRKSWTSGREMYLQKDGTLAGPERTQWAACYFALALDREAGRKM